ncbi:MAG TPA: hypothetical protein VFU57_08260, partial [Candidatus Acidoferrales bacterium]|nr:hypothetical protein [Candidatus Acidoferrales bacterium]
MAIEFEFRGEWYRVDTPQEVVALKKYLKAHGQDEEGSAPNSYGGLPAHGKWTSDLFTLLMERIGYFEKKFLAALLSVAQPMDANTLARLAFPGNYRREKRKLRRKVERNGLLVMGGIQSGLVRHVRALGLEPFDLYQVHISWKDDRRTRYFTVDP